MIENVGPYAPSKPIHDLSLFTAYPSDFCATDPKHIKIFGERLYALRKNARERNSEIVYIEGKASYGPLYCDVVTQSDLARKLHVSTQWVSNYETGKKKSIPMDRLLEICSIFGATPHYLLGYTSQPDRVLIVKDGNVECDKDGKPNEYLFPFSDINLSQKKANITFAGLEMSNPKQFHVLCELLNLGPKAKEVCFSTMSTLLQSGIANLDV